MDSIGTIILAVVAGMVCGAGLIFLGIVGYMRVKKTPPPPASRSEPEADTYLERPKGLDQAIQAPVLPAMPDHYRTLDNVPIPAEALPWLDGVGGIVAGQRISIRQEETIIGRSRVCDVQIHDPKVSRQHAMLRLYKGRYFIQDMQSSRGTIVNSQRVQTHLLQDGDQVRLGDSVLVFHFPPAS